MKNFFLFTLLFLCFSVYAFNETTIPDEFSIKNCKNAKNCSFIMIDANKQAELYIAHHKPGAFYFFDNTHQKQITLNFRGRNNNDFSPGYGIMRFDAIDQQGSVIAKLIIKKREFDVPSVLKIYNKSGTELLATIDGGLFEFGTEQFLYTKDNTQMIAKLTRPLWTLSSDSDIKIINKEDLPTELTPNLLMASLTLYCTNFGRIFVNNDSISPQSMQILQAKLAEMAAGNSGLSLNNSTVSSSEITDANKLLTQSYQQTFKESFYEDDTAVGRLEKLTRLIDLGRDMIISQTLSMQQEEAILQYLLQELQASPN